MFPPIRLVEFWWRSRAPAGRRETIVRWLISRGKSRLPPPASIEPLVQGCRYGYRRTRWQVQWGYWHWADVADLFRQRLAVSPASEPT